MTASRSIGSRAERRRSAPDSRMRGGLLSPAGQDDPLVTAVLASAPHGSMLGRDAAATLAWCVEVGRHAPIIGEGETKRLWALLATVSRRDVSAARMLEPHLDALSILHQSGTDLLRDKDPWGLEQIGADGDASRGVYAAESGDTRLEARLTDGSWRLRGTKPWCSLAELVSHALITAHVDDSHRQLFAVEMGASGVHPRRDEWFARGLPNVVSSPVDFDGVLAVPVGDPDWYLSRPGFAWGGMSVAACWWGAARAAQSAASTRPR